MYNLSAAVSILLLSLFHLTWAQVPFPNQCPDVKIVEEFDLDAYMGVWYEYSKYPFVFEVGKKCMYARYENIGNNSISVVNAAVNRLTGNPTNVTGSAKVLGPGQLAVIFNKRQNAEKANYLVLGTDYTSYVVVYSCTSFEPIAHTKIVWILTRERKPSQEAVNAAKKIMDDNKLPQLFLMDTIQDNCPETKTAAEAELEVGAMTTESNINLEIANTEQPKMIDEA